MHGKEKKKEEQKKEEEKIGKIIHDEIWKDFEFEDLLID